MSPRVVVVAGSAPATASLLGEQAAFLQTIPHAPVVLVVLGFRTDQVAHPLDGFGFLVPRGEGLRVLGCVFSSTLFAGRAPPGHVCMTAFVGGRRHPDVVGRSDADLVDLVRDELGSVLGLEGRPALSHVQRMGQAIPQYEPPQAEARAAARALEERVPGLFLAGSWRDGVSMPDRIAGSRRLAGRVATAARLRTGVSPA